MEGSRLHRAVEYGVSDHLWVAGDGIGTLVWSECLASRGGDHHRAVDSDRRGFEPGLVSEHSSSSRQAADAKTPRLFRNSNPGRRIGGVWHISYTVQSRYTFGVWGSILPILIRVGVTCGRSRRVW